MPWTPQEQAQLDQLRFKALQASLTPEEQLALKQLQNQLAADQPPQLAALQTEIATLRGQIAALQDDNEMLAQLLAQHEQLLAEGRQWLNHFEARHQTLQHHYQQLAPATSSTH